MITNIKYPTFEMSNFLYPKLKKLQSEYEDAKYNPYDDDDLVSIIDLYTDDVDYDFDEGDYHPKYHIEYFAFEDLKTEFYYHFRTELLEYGNYIMLCIFNKAIEIALDIYFTPEIYIININDRINNH